MAVLAGCAGGSPGATPRVLVYTNANGYVHASIPVGAAALGEIGERNGFAVDVTDDSLAFTPERLATYAAVVFLSTTGDVLSSAQEAAFEDYVEGGGGFVGVHAAADTEVDWPWYGRAVGAYFDNHPPTQQAAIDVVTADHPATRALPARWTRTDEWYSFREAPTGVTVLLRLDESSYDGGTMGADHPIAWAHAVGDGRALYTALGHTAESYAEPAFRGHLGGAVCWAGRLPCAR
ncbi:ThuA domain-containing protein [Rubrivirga sp.]|uniref:ThuA domain-containing protein n=1 Tax=Rubrivirga sp. TaxID=1885344 RepID=UPI003B522C19